VVDLAGMRDGIARLGGAKSNPNKSKSQIAYFY